MAAAPSRQGTKVSRAATITLKPAPEPKAAPAPAAAPAAAADGKSAVEEKPVVYAEVKTVSGGVPGGYRDGKCGEAKFSQPIGIGYDLKKHVLLVADFLNHRIRKIDPKTDEVSSVAGAGTPGDDGGLAYLAKFNQPRAVAVDPTDGSIVVVDANRLRRIKVGGEVELIAGSENSANEDEDEAKDGKGGDARFEVPNGIAIDPTNGHIYVADTCANQIRRVDGKTGDVITVAGSGAEDQNVDGEAMKAAIHQPMGLALDATAQILYISGEKAIRKFDIKAKTVSTLQTAEPLVTAGIALAGNTKFLVVTDTSANSVCAVSTAPIADPQSKFNGKHAVTRLTPPKEPGSGGAPFNRPMGVAFDGTDDSCRTVFVADTFGERIRKVTIPSGGEFGQAGSADCRMCGTDGGCNIM